MQTFADSFCYYIYGLNLITNRSLPGLTPHCSPINAAAAIAVELIGVTTADHPLLQRSFWQVSAADEQKIGFCLWQTETEEGIYWRLRSVEPDEVLEFVIHPDGRQIWGFWSAESLFQDAVSMLLGGVLGHVLRLRGTLCLHASVVAIQDRAIALIGASGAGKSTTAAALALHGYAALTDDIAALHRIENQTWVQPGYPALRLWQPSLQALAVPTADLTRVFNRLDKRFFELQSAPSDRQPQQFIDHPLPLAAIYVLQPREAGRDCAIVQPLPAIAALQQLLMHSYGRDILTRSQQQQELQELSAIAQALPIRLLSRPDDLQHLDRLCTLIADDLASLSHSESRQDPQLQKLPSSHAFSLPV